MICAKRSQRLDCGFRIADCGFTTDLRRDVSYGLPPPACPGQSRKTNPIPGRGEARGAWDAEQTCETNPICWSQLCKTNPISARSRRRPFQSDAHRAKQSQSPPNQQEGQVLCGKGVMVNRTFHRLRQNKANFSMADWRQTGGGTTNCAKRTQSPAVPGGRGPGGRGAWARLCKTNPISTQPGPQGRAIVRNEPNWGGCQAGTPNPRRAEPCKTNPIRGDVAWAGAWGARDVVAVQTNPISGAGPGGPSSPLDPPTSPLPSRLCQTNPIGTGAM